jgi:hypothetical protein
MLAFSGPSLAIQHYGSSCQIDQATYFTIVTNDQVFFPALGISQHFSISSKLVAGQSEQEIHFDGSGPIPSDVYRYNHIICDLS